jgi:hypothetical protein
MSRAASGAEVKSGPAFNSDLGYLGESSRPLTSLIFLLPFVLLYEAGVRLLLSDPVQGTQHIVAFTMLQRFFAVFGATGQYLPAFSLVAILLAWHVARKDRWNVRFLALLGMGAESIALGIPLIVFALALARFFPLAAPLPSGSLSETLVLSLGAGVYEELVFRLMLCTGLAMLLKNGLKLSERSSMLLLVFLSATLFSAYHYLGNEAFYWRNFVFRLLAGVYFSILFLSRGFGVTAGSHMAYDILVVLR